MTSMIARCPLFVVTLGQRGDQFPFLVERANHDLELWIREDPGYPNIRWGNAGKPARDRATKSASSAFATDCEIAAAVSGCDRILSNRNSISI